MAGEKLDKHRAELDVDAELFASFARRSFRWSLVRFDPTTGQHPVPPTITFSLDECDVAATHRDEAGPPSHAAQLAARSADRCRSSQPRMTAMARGSCRR